MRRTLAPLGLLLALLGGCTVLNPLDGYEGGGAGAKASAGAGQGGAQASAGSGASDTGSLTGRVLGPDRLTPVLRATISVVSLASAPTPLPRGASCGHCAPLVGLVASTVSDASGEFVMPPVASGSYYLVVEKAGFRRVRRIDVGAAVQAVPVGLTTLPALDDPESGDEVPGMTMVTAHFDEAEISLAQLGLSPKALQTVPSEPLDDGPATLLRDSARLGKARYLFLPSGNLTRQRIDDESVDLSGDAVVVDTVRRFVSEGGTLYVTDLHYDFVARAFPGFLRWRGQSAVACSGCACVECDRPSWVSAQIDDPGLSAWLGTQGVGAFEPTQSYTAIDTVSSAKGPDAGGGAVTITPTIWMHEREHETELLLPAIVSFPYGCGAVFFASYGRPQFTPELIPQVRASWGALLEASSCPP